MNELVSNEFYKQIKEILENARKQVYQTANTAMVFAYWQIGKKIVDNQGGENRADYGSKLITELAKQLTEDFGKGFDERNLRNMRSFYLVYPNWNAVRSELSWTHYRSLMRVESKEARDWYFTI